MCSSQEPVEWWKIRQNWTWWTGTTNGSVQNSTNSNHAVKFIIMTRNMFFQTRSLYYATVSFLITWRSSSSKSAAVYKISRKSGDFSQRYGDISIYKMAAVCYLGIVLPPYETSDEVSVAGCSCLSNSCQSDTHIWKYSYLNFSHIGLFRPPKWGFWGT